MISSVFKEGLSIDQLTIKSHLNKGKCDLNQSKVDSYVECVAKNNS